MEDTQMRKTTTMLLGGLLLLAGCATSERARDAAQSGSGAAPDAKERLISTQITNATWDHVLEGPATLTAVRQTCKEGNLEMYVSGSSVCPATKPGDAKTVSGQNQFTLQGGQHLCAAVGGGQGPCTLMYQQSKEGQ
jgi:hypothetical protein